LFHDDNLQKRIVLLITSSISVENGKLDIVKYLIKSKADINTIDKNGQTPLHLALDVSIVKLLIKSKTDLNAIDQYGHTPLHLCACKSNFDLVKYLIECKADINVKDKYGRASSQG